MNNNNKLTTIVNYLFIFLVINYRLIVSYITHVDSAGYALIFLSILVFVINARSFNSLQLKKPIIFWLVWCVYVFLNYYMHPHTHASLSFVALYRKIFIPLIVMTVVVKEYQRNTNGLFWICFITHAVFMAAGYYFDRGILYRDLGEENSLGNAYAIISSFTIFYLMLLNHAKKVPTVIFLALAGFVVFVLAMSGTRKAFGAGVLLLAFWGWSQLNIKKIRSWVLVGVLIVVGLWGYDYLMENTFVGQRMEYLEEQQEKVLLPSDAPKFLQLFGDRAPHYYYGWLIFISHPLSGVGLVQADVEGLYIHSEYMSQLADNGIVGFALFFALYSWVSINLVKRNKDNKKIGRSMLGGLFCMLFLFLTTWAWEFPQYFICLGVLVGYCLYGYNDFPHVIGEKNE